MMEHLSLELLRQKVIKMSEARLRQKLVQAGYREVDVAKFDRATLLEYYAKVLLTETAYVPAKEEQEEGDEAASDGEEKVEFVESDAGVQNTAGGEKSADEKRIVNEESLLLLEMKKLEEQRLQREMEERRWQQQQEEQRLQLEQQRVLEEKRLEMQRMQLEQQRVLEEKRLEEQKLQREQQLEQQRIQLEQQRILEEKKCELQFEEQRRQREFQEMKWREDRAYKESTAVQIKTWGDALRNTITKMPSEGIDVVSWFVSIDKLFEQLTVPADLQAILIRPYLSDRRGGGEL